MIIERRCPRRWSGPSGDTTALTGKDELVHGRRCLPADGTPTKPVEVRTAPTSHDHVTCREYCSGSPRRKQVHAIATGQWHSHGARHHAQCLFIALQVGHDNGNARERDAMSKHR